MNNLVGRNSEVSEIKELIQKSIYNKSPFVLLSGESGVGKSSLLSYIFENQKFPVINTFAREYDKLPYGLIFSILQKYLHDKNLSDSDSIPGLTELQPIFPNVNASLLDNSFTRESIITAITKLFQHIGKNDQVIFQLDDLQWADNASMEILPEIINSIQLEPIIFFGTFRSEDIDRDHPLRRFRNDLRRMRLLHEMHLQPLSTRDTKLIIESILQDKASASLVDFMQEKSQGYPLYITELTKTLKEKQLLNKTDTEFTLVDNKNIPIPISIKDSLNLSLESLSTEAINLLEIAALLGNEFDFSMLINIAGSDTDIEELFEHKIIDEIDNKRGRFRHNLIRETILDDIVWSKRRKLHQAIAIHLEKSHTNPQRIAHHWLLAGNEEKARSSFIDAANQACSLYAYSDATKLATQSLEIWPPDIEEEKRLQVLEQLAHCAQLSGQYQIASKSLEELLEVESFKKNISRQTEALRSLATVYGLQGLWDKSISLRLKLAEYLIDSNNPNEAAAEMHTAGSRLVGLLKLSQALETIRKTIKIAEKGKRDDIKAMAMGLEGNILSMQGKFEEGKTKAREALNFALKNDLTLAASDVYRRLAATLEYASDYTGAKKAYYEALDYCRLHGADTQTHICMSCMTALLFWTGEFSKAIDLCQELIKNEDAPIGSYGTAIGSLGIIQAYRGEIKTARKHLSESLELCVENEVAAAELIIRWGIAYLESTENNTEEAKRQYLLLLDRWQETQDRHDSIPALCFAAVFFSDINDKKSLTRCSESLTIIATETNNPEAMAALGLAMGESCRLNNDKIEAIIKLKQAVDILQKIEMPLLQIISEFRLGMTLAETGNESEAFRFLKSAQSKAKKMGIRPLTAQIDEVIGSIDITSESEIQDSSDSNKLTKRQQEILDQLVKGLTNKEIGEKLFLSVRTIDMHVANILIRLDCRTRSEAVQKALKLGLVTTDSSSN